MEQVYRLAKVTNRGIVVVITGRTGTRARVSTWCWHGRITAMGVRKSVDKIEKPSGCVGIGTHIL